MLLGHIMLPSTQKKNLRKDPNFPSKRKDHNYLLNPIVKNNRIFQKCLSQQKTSFPRAVLGNKTQVWDVSD
jgi:hypothetical protein